MSNYKRRKTRTSRKGFAGVALSFISKLVQQKQQFDQDNRDRRDRRETDRGALYQSDLSQLEQYNNYNNTEGIRATAAQGIRLPGTPATILGGGGLNQISSGVSFLTGNSHEQGGIGVDVNQDGQEDIELESMEAVSGEMVFSKRRKLPSEAVDYLEENGFTNGFNKLSYADAVKKLGLIEKKMEDKLELYDPTATTTANLMLERISNVIEGLFSIQEETKL
ncbi:hypothetical protein LCGC14_0246420 [marine sediment metagenome]|uniref:Uncharacterized protein n=1 Tax=marine sediment metagenome TaxID=412755 RepID=A0A0F9WR81_9ZZZZ